MCLIIILCLFILSCGVFQKDNRRFKTINSELLPYVELFDNYLETNSSKVGLGFVAGMERQAGVCYTTFYAGKAYKEIWINEDEWPYYNERQREWLIFHELGHCILNKKHNDNQFSYNYCPVSIMRSYLINYWESIDCFEANYDYYIQEMRN